MKPFYQLGRLQVCPMVMAPIVRPGFGVYCLHRILVVRVWRLQVSFGWAPAATPPPPPAAADDDEVTRPTRPTRVRVRRLS